MNRPSHALPTIVVGVLILDIWLLITAPLLMGAIALAGFAVIALAVLEAGDRP